LDFERARASESTTLRTQKILFADLGYKFSSINVPAYLEDQLYLTPRLSILAGAQAIFAQRHFQDTFVDDGEGNQSNRQNFWGFNPKLGAIYEINRQTQAFMNVSRSWQPPSLDNGRLY
jgi:outer membrane receptor protein involved in Fe transport